MITPEFVCAFRKQVETADRILLCGHIRPDGDCIGSTTALALSLKAQGKNPMLYYEGDYESFNWLIDLARQQGIPVLDTLEQLNQASRGAFKFIWADLADPERAGQAKIMKKFASDTICIDHHLFTGEYADLNWIEPEASSTCELICILLKELGWSISPDAAAALFTGMATDTGGFRHSSMRPDVFTMLGELTAAGVDITGIMNHLFHSKTFREQKMLGLVLSEAKLYRGGKVIVSEVTRADFLRMGAGPSDCESAVGALTETEGADVAVFMRELDPKPDSGNRAQIRVNLRSKAIVDVSKVARAFGGGGHVRAAGCTICEPLLLVRERILAEIDKQLSPEEKP